MPAPRVAVDATSLYGARTGVGRFTAEVLAHAGGRTDVQVAAYAITWRGGRDLDQLLPPGVGAAPGRRLPARPLRLLWQRMDRPRIDRWLGPTDVVHGTNFVAPPTRAASVLTVHDLTYLHHPEMCTDDVLQYRDLVPRALRRGATVHAVSSFVAEEVRDHYDLPAERVVPVLNGISRPPAAGSASAGRRQAGADRYLLWLGTVEPRKDLPTLVAAFDAVAADDPDLRLVLAGPDGWGTEALRAALASARHPERVVRLGWVEEATRADLLAGAEALVLASRYEGFGLPAGEAMVAGTPVVATAVGGLTEVVGEAGLLVPPGDPAALAEALAQVTSDADTRRRLSAQGTERAAELTWDRTVDGLVALWGRLAGR